MRRTLDVNAADLNLAHNWKRYGHKVAAFRVEASDERVTEPRFKTINRFPVFEISDVVSQPGRLSRVGNTDQ